MQCMVNVIIPLRVIPEGVPLGVMVEIASLIVVVLQHKMDHSLTGESVPHGFCQLGQDVRTRIVNDGVNRVQAKTVEMIFLQPVQRIMNKVITNRPAVRAIEIDRWPPRSRVAIGEKLRYIEPEIISFWPKVVVNHIKEHHQIFGVRPLDETFQIFGTAITARWSIRQNTVISPTPLTGEAREWHQFDSSNAQCRKIIQLLFCS